MAQSKKTVVKKTTAQPSKAPKVSHTIPEGFKIPASAMVPNWDYESHPILTGTVIEVKTVQKKKPRKGEDPTTRLMHVQDDEGAMVQVWESAALRGLFDEVVKGASIYIAYEGEGEPQPGKNPMKLFSVGYRLPDEVEAEKTRAKGKKPF